MLLLMLISSKKNYLQYKPNKLDKDHLTQEMYPFFPGWVIVIL